MMKLSLFYVFFFIILSCSSGNNDDIPPYAGQYFFVKNYAVINGVKQSENNHEGTCSGKSNYYIKADNKFINEVWGANQGKCSLIGTYEYTYNTYDSTIDGQKVKFDGNFLIITNISSSPYNTIENIYYYKRN